jgi:5-methylcytosine-specific restriction endonuclease McrA
MARVRRRMDFRLRKWRELRAVIFKRDAFTCRSCGHRPARASIPEAYDGRYTILGPNGTDLMLDHIRPLCQGGNDSPRNLQTLCVSCNCRKGGG